MAGEIQLNSTTFATESGGTVTIANVDSATNRTNLGLGSIATQASDSIDINGGTIDGTTIGGTSAAAGTFTTFTSTGIDDNASSTALTIDSSGNVGVNCSPSTKVEVNGSADAVLRLTDVATIGAADRKVGGVEFYQNDASGGAGIGSSIESYHANQSGDTDLRLSTGDNTERMRIDSSGNVGVNCSPSTKVEVSGSADAVLRLTDVATIGAADRKVGGVEFYQNDASGGAGIGSSIESYHVNASGDTDLRFATGDNTKRMTIDSSGNIGAPTGTNIYNASDERLKQNITDLSGSLQKVLSMRGVSFNWIDEFCDAEADKTLYGLIAQELQMVDSNLVDSFSDNTITAGSVTVENPLRVNEKFIIPMLVESIKEQQSQIDALTARIEALETA